MPWHLPRLDNPARGARGLGGGLFRQKLSRSRGAHRLRATCDGDTRCDFTRMDDDVSSATWSPELSAVPGWPAAAGLGVRQRDADPDPGDGRDLATDAAGDADRPGRAPARRARR